jgi:DNA-binding Lrp family transcriptional regulator
LKFLRQNPTASDRIPIKHIASFLGIEPESLSRIRKRLSKTRK